MLAREAARGDTAMAGAPARTLVVITIEHLPARALGCYGNTTARTPHLDALARHGARFEHCTVASPLCVPSRVAFFTGRYSSNTGCRDNTRLLPDSEEHHLPGLLRDAGYRCGLFGKNHCFPDPRAAGFSDVMDEFNARRAQRQAYGAELPGPANPIDPDLLAQQTRRFRWGEHPRPIWYGGTYPFAAAESPARQNVNNALRFLETCDDEPAFLWVSFSDPHPPYRAPHPYDVLFDADQMELPVRPDDELANKPYVQQVYYHGGWLQLMDDAQLRQSTAYYHGMVSYVDDCLGHLFDGMRDLGRWDDATIFATGDHGEYLGEHGLIRKSAAFYDCLVQVPLIVHGLPGADAGEVLPLLIEQTDVYPTILQRAGIAAPGGIQGRSISDVLTGSAPARESTYAEVGSSQPLPPGGSKAELAALLAGVSRDEPLENLPLVESGTFFLSRGRMIRTQDWKYAHYVGDKPELYDLRSDPGELDNLAGMPEHREKEEELRRRLLERAITAADPR